MLNLVQQILFSKFVLTGSLLCTLFSQEARAQGNLLVTPKRIVFDGSKRYEELNVANVGPDTARYVISLVHYRMTEAGTFETITTPDPGQNFADKNLRIFPRSVVLGPNEAQLVKIQLIKGQSLPPGEYRSHLYMRAVPKKAPLGLAEKDAEKDSLVSVKLVPVFGIGIAVIIRVGKSDAVVEFSGVSLKMENDTTPVVNMILNRTGNMSVYGDVAVDHISMAGKITRVGIVKGMAVYTPNTVRTFRLPLNNHAGVDYTKGKLQLVYSDQSPKPVKLTEAELDLRLQAFSLK